MTNPLNTNYLLELFSCFFKPSGGKLIEICISELKYNYLPTEEFKIIYKDVCSHYDLLKRPPTIGFISQNHSKEYKVLQLLEQIKKTEYLGEVDDLLKKLEEYIQESIFLISYDELGDVWNSGDKKKAFQVLLRTAEDIKDYSITEKKFTKIFADLEKRREAKKRKLIELENRNKTLKIPFYVDIVDLYFKGGMGRGEIFLIIAPSGRYKSTSVRHFAYNAATIGGYTVVHFQGEDTEENTTDMYDSVLFGEELYNIETNNIPDKKYQQVLENVKRFLKIDSGEIYLKPFEKFGSATLSECDKYLSELVSQGIYPDLIIWDYMELFDPGDGSFYKSDQTRQKREAIVNRMKNICMHYDCAGITPTQAMDINEAQLNDPEFIIKRSHISEFKGLVKPFSGVLSWNQTVDEETNGILRVGYDKIRKYKKNPKPSYICQDLTYGKFYDKKRTGELFGFTPS